MIDAAEALRIQLVSETTGHEDLLPATMGLATKIAERPPLAVQKIKAGMRNALDQIGPNLGKCVSVSGELFKPKITEKAGKLLSRSERPSSKDVN